mgnify:CR=1 FL=1
MSRWKLTLAAIVAPPLLGACHGDIFSIKPETNATVPKKAPQADPVDDDAETAPQ